MSMNIHFVATRKILVIKTGKTDTQEIKFSEWQTPSAVTRAIMASDDQINAYKAWVLSNFTEDQEEDVFADDDIFNDGEPVGKTIFNPGKDHIAAFDQWLLMCQLEGFEVTAEAW